MPLLGINAKIVEPTLPRDQELYNGAPIGNAVQWSPLSVLRCRMLSWVMAKSVLSNATRFLTAGFSWPVEAGIHVVPKSTVLYTVPDNTTKIVVPLTNTLLDFSGKLIDRQVLP